MNLLKRRLPSTVEVGGISFNIDTRYDTALAILDCLADDLFPEEDRMEMALDMFYKNAMPSRKDVALALMYKFLNMGELNDSEPPKKPQKKLIDFDRDGNFIYSHFLRIYGIDLQDNPIHWWKFQVLMSDLGEKTSLQNVMNIRTMKVEDYPLEERPRLMALQAEYDVSVKDFNGHIETLEERNKRWKEG